MKKIILIVLLIAANELHAQQCWLESKSGGHAKIAFAFTGEYSLKSFKPNGFSGMSLSAGVWVENMGFQVGISDFKMSSTVVADRSVFFSMHYKIEIGESIFFDPYFSVGTKNFQDIGIRAMYDVYKNGIGVGVVVSRSMHYGIGVVIRPIKN